MSQVRFPQTLWCVFVAASLILLTCPRVHAQQFVLFDVTFTFTKDDADNSKPSKSHYYVRDMAMNADRPKDWTSPVDYRNGTVHIRAEVLEKPAGGVPTTWTLCYIPNKGQKAGYGCTGTDIFKEKGVYEKDVRMTSFWQNDNIVWEEGIKEMHLVIKDDSGGAGHAHKRADHEKFFPTKMRITMIQVAKGATYDPKLVPNLPAPAVPSLPAVQMFVPGFVVRELPVKLTNPVNIEYAPDGRLFAAGYDGRVHMLKDTNGDGLEDMVITIWDKTSADYPLGMVVRDNAVYVLRQAELERFIDTDNDGVPDKREIMLKDWDDPKLQQHPLILRRRVDYGMGLAIGPDGSIYIGMGNAAYNNAYMIDEDGKCNYDPKNLRSCVLKFSPDGKKKELLLTGTRYLMSMQFNHHGDLFATDQEGATWLPNGNPFDELLHLQPGRHYGFPPRHPKYLPNVIDEPSVFDYAPQHQSLCGFRFNDGTAFGPSWWKGDALLAGFTRGKLYRTKLVKSDAGYVAQNQLIAGMQSLASDVSLSPTGDLVVASHTGKPDWGTGPSGIGLLHKISYRHKEAAVPVGVWSAGPGEFRVSFDKPLDAKQLKNPTKQVRITAGKHVFAGDRFETIRPGYEVVKMQVAAPRRDVAVLSAALAADGRTLILNTGKSTIAENYAITLPSVHTPTPTKGEVVQQPVIDLLTDLNGVAVQWKPTTGEGTVNGWLPHAELGVASQLTGVQQQLVEAIKKPGTLTLRGQLDLWEMLHPAIQPGAKLDYERPVEIVKVWLTASSSFRMKWGTTELSSSAEQEEPRITLKHASKDARWLPFEISLPTGDRDPKLQFRWSTSDDSRPRAFPLRRFLLPWAMPSTEKQEVVDRSQMPELKGGDHERGKRLFFSDTVNCSKCHQVRGEGTKIGPDLSNLTQRDYDSVLRDIREPSAAINPDYLSYTVNLTDGRVLTGVIHKESKESISIADNAGKIIDVNRKDIEKVTAAKTSVMLEELLKKLSAEQLRDLMAFLLLEPAKR